MPRIASTKTAAKTTRTVAARKTPAKKTVAKKTAAKKPVVRRTKKPALQVTPVKYTFTKATLAQELAERTETDTKVAKLYLQALEDLILGTVHPKGAGQFTIPGVLKVVTRKTKPVKGGVKKTNPLTGLEYVTKAKPASVKVRVRPGTKLKQAAVQ